MQLVVGKALKKPSNRNAPFQFSQAQTSALVNTQTKGQVSVIGAIEPQFLGLIKLRGVTVGRTDAQGHQGPDGQAHAPHLTGLNGASITQLIG